MRKSRHFFLSFLRNVRGLSVVRSPRADDERELFASVEDLGQVVSSPWAMPFERRNHIFLCRDLKISVQELLAARKEVVVTDVISRSVSNRFYPLPNDSLDELRIGQTCFPGCEGEVFVGGENGIRVCLDEIEFVFGCQTQIDARVAVDR